MIEPESLLQKWGDFHDAVIKKLAIDFRGPFGNEMAISMNFHAMTSEGTWVMVTLDFDDVKNFAGRLPRDPSETVLFSASLTDASNEQAHFDSDRHSPEKKSEGNSYYGFSFDGKLTSLKESALGPKT